jgi:hypothetical protein
MASKPKPPTTMPAKNCRHPESRREALPEVGTQAGTREPNPAVVADPTPKSLCARKIFVTVLTCEAEVWALPRWDFVRAQTLARLTLLWKVVAG